MVKNTNYPLASPQLAQLLDLMKENPHLPVVPMVRSEIVCDDSWAYWMGSWGNAQVDLYLLTDSRVLFKGDDDAYDVLLHFMDPDKLDNMTTKEMYVAYDDLPWKKAIIVYIETPEE